MDPQRVEDVFGEWFELSSLSSQDVDLSGYFIADEGRNLFEIPPGTVLSAGSSLVFGRSSDVSQNGGQTVDVVTENVTLNNNTVVLNSGMTDAKEIFEEMVVVGTSGSGIEMGLEAAKQATIGAVNSAQIMLNFCAQTPTYR